MCDTEKNRSSSARIKLNWGYFDSRLWKFITSPKQKFMKFVLIRWFCNLVFWYSPLWLWFEEKNTRRKIIGFWTLNASLYSISHKSRRTIRANFYCAINKKFKISCVSRLNKKWWTFWMVNSTLLKFPGVCLEKNLSLQVLDFSATERLACSTQTDFYIVKVFLSCERNEILWPNICGAESIYYTAYITLKFRDSETNLVKHRKNSIILKRQSLSLKINLKKSIKMKD